MQIFLGLRPLEDPIGAIGCRIESLLWGDARAQHVSVIAMINGQQPIQLEIDVGEAKRQLIKKMILKSTPFYSEMQNLSHIEFLGTVTALSSYDELIQLAWTYLQSYPNYRFFSNNCRTFVDYLIDHLFSGQTGIPRFKGSTLEYYHAKRKADHPGLLIKLENYVKKIHRIIRSITL